MLSSYDYDLPKAFIAQESASPKSSSKLMVLGSNIEHRIFEDLPEYLEKGDVLVLNNTKVIPARLRGLKATGGKVEVTLVKELEENRWRCLVKGKLAQGAEVFFKGGAKGRIIKNEIAFNCDPMTLMREQGEAPLPPYVKNMVPLEHYQTVYAMIPGSVAAPTAGLHFTPELLQELRGKGVETAFVTLHIGPGTFAPVRKQLAGHRMEAEYFTIGESDARAINKARRVIAVGTTTVKALESASFNGDIRPISGCSELFIYPPYRFKSRIHALITNFHLPRSTLLMLVCAYAGRERILHAYMEAVKRAYRFYSFGDAMLIFGDNYV